jgi:hypothetical protein
MNDRNGWLWWIVIVLLVLWLCRGRVRRAGAAGWIGWDWDNQPKPATPPISPGLSPGGPAGTAPTVDAIDGKGCAC